MSLSFWNSYTEPVYVALLMPDDECNPAWRKSGWYVVNPGDTVQVFTGDLQQLPDPNWAWFAQAGGADGPCWSGDPQHHLYAVPHNAGFGQCYADLDGCNAAYPFISATFSPEWSSLTVVLLGPGTAGQGFQGFAGGLPVYVPTAVQFLAGTLGPSTITGSASWTLNNQGFWDFIGSVHESGLIGQDYSFGMVLDLGDAGNPIAVFRTGSVGPYAPFFNPDDSWNAQGFDQRIVDQWPAIVAATCHSDLSVRDDAAHVIELAELVLQP
jgi:hypothetical protein